MSSSRPKILLSVFLRLSPSVCVCLSFLRCALSFALFLSLSLSEAFFASRVLSKTPPSLRNLSEKTRAHENDRRHKKVLPFIIRSQTDRQERKESVAHLSPFIRARERLLERSRGKKSFALFLSLSLSLCVYIYRAHTASSS